MIKKVVYFLFLTFISTTAHAEMQIRQFGGITYVDETTVSELENLFKQHNYQRFRALEDNAYPAIIIRKIPTDFQEIKSQKYRNELFIRMLTPLAFKVNEEISNERNMLLRIERHWERDKKLSSSEQRKLEILAKKYDYFTRQKDDIRIGNQILNLKLRVNVVPPSILVSTAAIESNWGDSRLVKEANSLYKEKIWYTKEGLEPLENKQDGFRFKIFGSLIESMRSFALTFNSNINYETAWEMRAELHKRHKVILGESLAFSLASSSTLPNFAGILDYTSAYYDLMALDMGKIKRETQNDTKNNANSL